MPGMRSNPYGSHMLAATPDEVMPFEPSDGRRAPGRLLRFVAGAARIAPIPLAITVGLLLAEDAFEFGDGFLLTTLVVGFSVVVVLLVIGLRSLRTAEGQARAALGRAAAAESSQRARADELARVLEASRGLVLTRDGQVDYLGVLAAITPEGATSFLVRVESETDARVVAAHGPLAATLVGVHRPVPDATLDAAGATLDAADAADAASPIASYSASGRAVGRAMAPEHLLGLRTEVVAALRVRLADHDGRCLGWLHILDQRGEGILEPSFVNLAGLVANQIAVAMENHALLVRVRRQLVEVQRVQQQLVQASKLGAIGELSAAVAHEVNNPLTGILGFAELLTTELPDGDPRREEAIVIRDEAIRARTIVRALLEFSRPRLPQRIRTDLNDLARSTLELVDFRAAEADVRIEADLGDVPSLELDPDAFRQVLLNLFNNALDAMPQGGLLRISTVGEPDRVGLSVTDGGVGMDEKTRDRIFTPFFSARPGGGKSGLGLAVSLQIVEGHGGTIEVESAPGRGSTFHVWLPTKWPSFEGSVVVPGMDHALTRRHEEPGPSDAASAATPAGDGLAPDAAAPTVAEAPVEPGSGREVAA
jgi:signal transduction histidine kinase